MNRGYYTTYSTTEESLPDPPSETVQQAPRRSGGVIIREFVELLLSPRAASEACGKGKHPVYESIEPSTSDDEGIFYATLLDHLPIPEDLFSWTNLFNLASSNFPLVGGSNSDSLYSLDWTRIYIGSVLYLVSFAYYSLFTISLFINVRCLPFVSLILSRDV